MFELGLLLLGCFLAGCAFVFWLGGRLRSQATGFPPMWHGPGQPPDEPRNVPGPTCPCHVCQGMTRREWVAAVDNCPKRKAKLTTFGAACDAIAADVRASKGSAIHRAPPEPQADSPCYYGHAYRAGKCTGCGREEPPPTFRGGIVHMDARTNTPDQVWRDGKPVDLCRNCSQPLAEPSPGCVDHEAIAAFIQASKARPE